MNIGLIIYDRLDALTGGYIYDRMLVENLQQRGHQVEVISLRRHYYIRNLFDNFSPDLVSRLVSAGYDLLLQDGLTHPSLFGVNRRLEKSGRSPIVAIVHQVLCRQPRSSWLNRLYETVERPYFNSVHAYIYNSDTTCRTVGQLVPKSRPSIVAFPAGDRLGSLDCLDLIDSRARETGPLRLIFVGNVLPNKGLLPLIEDLSSLPADSWKMTIVGGLEMDPIYYRKVEQSVAAADLNRHVRFVGPKDGPELASLLAQSQVFVMPYSHEGFGMAHLEAMGFALPVIGCAEGAVREFVKHEQNGFLVYPTGRDKLPDYLNRLENDRQLLIKMSRAAWRTFQEHPLWEDTMDRIEHFLWDLAYNKTVNKKKIKNHSYLKETLNPEP